MKFKIAYVLLIAVAVQAHPAYPGYSFLPATTASVPQWFSQDHLPVPSDVKDFDADAGSFRTKRQIQLRWRNGRSLNEVNEPKKSVMNNENVATTPVRTKRQIQLRWRNGRSLKEVMNNSEDVANTVSALTNRQIQPPYIGSGSRRNGRSLNEPKSVLTADQFDPILYRQQRQILLRYRNIASRRHGRK